MIKFGKKKNHYEFIHDNLNNQWLFADLSNKKFRFYHKLGNIKIDKNYSDKINTNILFT